MAQGTDKGNILVHYHEGRLNNPGWAIGDAPNPTIFDHMHEIPFTLDAVSYNPRVHVRSCFHACACVYPPTHQTTHPPTHPPTNSPTHQPTRAGTLKSCGSSWA